MRHFRVIWLTLAALFAGREAAALTPDTAKDQPAIERVDSIRDALLERCGKDAGESGEEEVAQWSNWGNWRNWRNWGNWGNW